MLGLFTLIGVIYVAFQIFLIGFKEVWHKRFFVAMCSLTLVAAIFWLIITFPVIITYFKSTPSETIVKTIEPDKSTESITSPKTNTSSKIETTNYSSIGTDTFSISYNNVSYGYIYIPSDITDFFLYEQIGSSQSPDDSRPFVDEVGKNVGYIDKNKFLNNIGRYIQIANSRNKRLIVSANDPSINNWRANLDMKFGKTKSKLEAFEKSKPYVHSDKKPIEITGWINY